MQSACTENKRVVSVLVRGERGNIYNVYIDLADVLIAGYNI